MGTVRTLAIGDVHGCLDAMLSILDFACVNRSDRVVWLGDYIDKGPDSASVIDFLCGDTNKANHIYLRGNHEYLLEIAHRTDSNLSYWLQSGGQATMESYARTFGIDSVGSIPSSHWRFYKRLLPYYETESHIFVHAAIDPEKPLPDQEELDLYWGSFESIGSHISGKKIICGHRSQKTGLPKRLGDATCIDTFPAGSGWLSCLDVSTGKCFQANQQGQTRTLTLD